MASWLVLPSPDGWTDPCSSPGQGHCPSPDGWTDPCSSPGQGHCIVLLGKTLYSHSTSLHPGVQMGTCQLNAGDYPAMD